MMRVIMVFISFSLFSSAFSCDEDNPTRESFPKGQLTSAVSTPSQETPCLSLKIPPLSHGERRKVALNFDGGGLRGIFSLHVLQNIEKDLPSPINQYVDLISGTSTGGMIALGLGLNKKSEDILTVYTQKNKDIFYTSFCHKLKSGFGYFDERYSVEKFEPLLKDFYGPHTRLSEIRSVDVMAIATDMTAGLHRPFSTFAARSAPSENALIWEVARSTSAAPTYFEPFQYGGHVMVDGGLVANNPSLESALLIKKEYGWEDYKNLKTISIGTSNYYPQYTLKQVKDWGKLQWASPLGPIMIYTNSHSTHDHMKTLYSEDQYVRLNTLTDKEIALDSLRDIEKITSVALAYVQNNPQEIDQARKLLLNNGTKPSA